MAATAVVHDHFVLLVDKEEFESPPAWLSSNFHIIEGGTHGGGSSRNKLIIFKDGTYLELFNWIKEPVEFLDWADKKPGLIDFAVTTLPPVTPEQNFSKVQGNLSNISAVESLGVSYAHPLPGGRKRADGKEVRWKNSRPSFARTDATPNTELFPEKRIDVPFFCHDVTDRTIRVPFDDETLTTHPCGAVGVDNVEVLVPESHLDLYLRLYGAVLDTKKSELPTNDMQTGNVCFEIGVPNPLDSRPTYVAVSSAGHAETFFKGRGIGVRSLTLRKAKSAGGNPGTYPLAQHGTGSTIKLRG